MLPIDIHTHTLASGHGSTATIADLAKTAHQKGMTLLGISDHGPATPGSCKESYFRSLSNAPRQRCGISLLYGAEVNILDEQGNLDLPDCILSGLDFCIASIHPQSYNSAAYHRNSFWDRRQITEDSNAAKQANTLAYIRAMDNPYVKIIGHPEDQHYPIDYEQLVAAAARKHVIIEVNEASLAPGGYRGNPEDTAAALCTILSLCSKARLPVLLSSDSHGVSAVGEAPYAQALIAKVHFPQELILNYLPAEVFLSYLRHS